MKAVHNVSFVLLVIGGLNWLLHAFGWNLIDYIFNEGSTMTKVVYVIVGLATLVVLFTGKSKMAAPQQM
jgi:uncharacterized membrane protein YuzA (DUF378 family)